MQNHDIREASKKAGVKLWQIAEAIGINDGNFSRRLRKELPTEQKQRILNIVEDLKRTGGVA